MKINPISQTTRHLAPLLFLTWLLAVPVWAQTPVRLGPASAEEINKAFLVVEANLDSLKAHKKYIVAKGMINPELWTQYESWMKKYPNNINIPLAIGTVYYQASMPQPKDFLLKAAAMAPTNAHIWHMLAEDAYTKMQHDRFTEYSKKATLAEPANADYAFIYLRSLEKTEPIDYKREIADFVKRFPADERSALIMYKLGKRATSLKERIQYLEEFRQLYPVQKFKQSSAKLVELADAYLQTEPAKALALINELDEQSDSDWKIRKQMANSLIEINQLEQGQNFKEAIVKLDQVKRLNSLDDFLLLKKAALLEEMDDVSGAYQGLSVKFAKLPTDALYSALESYGKKLGKDKKQIDEDIETIRKRTATAAYPFALGLYTGNDTLRLNSLKGKVILLTFWFPGCGPCREEFPHFQSVVDSFKGDSLVYLGVNVKPAQDGFVLPFIKNSNSSFIPLRGNDSFASQHYGVTGAPANFLIDKDGMIIFKDFRTSEDNHRTLALMISSLLEKGSAKR